ncbi:MAG: metallophosphoesterase [Clostridiales bacterium]|nr:metallophosphoesterase [Clostridiales bacterium]
MAEIQIAHLSDPHVLRAYDGSKFDAHLLVPPVVYFRAALRKAVQYKPDCIVITGDLVHEGEEDDYAYLREIIKHEASGIPVLAALGNHDLKERFYRGYLGELRTKPYDYQADIRGYRFIALDTSAEGEVDGAITETQVDWLEDILKQPSPNGTILFGHHPLESRQGWFRSTYPKRLLDVLQDSDVIAYLCGHAHYFECRSLRNILQITADSLAHGAETTSEGIICTETRGYNTCWLEGRKLTVHAHQINSASYQAPLWVTKL